MAIPRDRHPYRAEVTLAPKDGRHLRPWAVAFNDVRDRYMGEACIHRIREALQLRAVDREMTQVIATLQVLAPLVPVQRLGRD